MFIYSFHVGSGCFDAQAFGDAVILARKAFDIAKKDFGMNLEILDSEFFLFFIHHLGIKWMG